MSRFVFRWRTHIDDEHLAASRLFQQHLATDSGELRRIGHHLSQGHLQFQQVLFRDLAQTHPQARHITAGQLIDDVFALAPKSHEACFLQHFQVRAGEFDVGRQFARQRFNGLFALRQ